MRCLANRLLFTLGALLLGGCANEFVRPAPGALSLGQSRYAQVVELMGEPTFTNENVTVNHETIRTADYYAYRFPKTAVDNSPHRYLHCSFFNDVLVGVEYNSSYKGDSTAFDPEKARTLEIGTSTGQSAIAALGPPSGEIIYPLVKDPHGRGLVYWYTVYYKLPELRVGEMYTTDAHRLIVFLDERGVVTDISYKGSDGVEQFGGHVTSGISEQQFPLSAISY